MSVYKDDVMERIHELIGDGYTVREAIAIMITETDSRRLGVWARTVVDREVKGNEDPRETE